MRGLPLILLAAAGLLLTGCVGTVVDAVTLPVRAAGKAVDLATTSQSESDENRGRELRKREERLGKLDRDYAKQRKKCDATDNRDSEKACEKARIIYAQMQELLPTIPAEPDD